MQSFLDLDHANWSLTDFEITPFAGKVKDRITCYPRKNNSV